MKEYQELVLTGFPEFWPESVNERQVLYLGPWCFAFNKRHNFFENDQFDICPSPWVNDDKKSKAAKEIQNLYDKIMPEMAGYLNRCIAKKHSQRFWELIAGTWLHDWLSIFYDRYFRLRNVVEKFADKQPLPVKLIPHGTRMVEVSVSNIHLHLPNLQLFSDMIRSSELAEHFHITEMMPSQITGDSVKADNAMPVMSLLVKAKECLIKFLEKYSGCILGRNLRGLSTVDRIQILLLLICRGCRGHVNRNIPENNNQSSILSDEMHSFDFGAENDLERTVQKLLPQYLPERFLKYCYVPRHADIYIGTDIYSKTPWQIAHHVEEGGHWLASQHGGSYGHLKNFGFHAYFEYEKSDRFLSWGWTHEHCGSSNRNISMPNPALSKLPKSKGSSTLVYCGNTFLAYIYRFYSCPQPEDMNKFFRDCTLFINSLSGDLLKNFIWRPHPFDYGCGEKEWIKQQCPYIRESNLPKGRMTDALRDCRLLVLDHPITAMLEALACEQPFILFYDPDIWRISEEARPFFDGMHEHGILFYDPKEAAQQAEKVWNNTRDWWNEEARRNFINKYARMYAYTSKSWKQELVKVISDYHKQNFQQ